MRKGARGIRNLFRFFFVGHAALTWCAVIFIASLTVAFATGFWLPARLANVILVAIPIAYLWGRLNLRDLKVQVERPTDRLQVGAFFEERITVSNRAWFPRLWLEVEDETELPGQRARRVVHLPAKQSRSWRTVTPCTRRGLFSVGPVRIRTGDLLGLFHHSKRYGAQQHVLVYPRAFELSRFQAPPAMLPGEGRQRRPTHQVTPNASSVRDYAPGDSFNRIHWRTTARTGELKVKQFELDPSSDVWIVLDLEAGVQAGSGDESTEEHGVQIAASVARYFLLNGRSVGFLAYGRELHREEPDRGLGQYTRILEALALARSEGDVSLADLLSREGRRFGRHTTIVVITPSTDEGWVASMQMLGARGVRLAAVLLESQTYGGTGDALMIYSTLIASDISTHLIKRDDDLVTALQGGAHPVAIAKGAWQ
jgi:uncharacterized protein (DUF58 family)